MNRRDKSQKCLSIEYLEDADTKIFCRCRYKILSVDAQFKTLKSI